MERFHWNKKGMVQQPTGYYVAFSEAQAEIERLTSERDELKADIVRLKMHLDPAERAAKANGKGLVKAEADRDKYKAALEQTEFALSQIIGDLPSRRDWLDPTIEAVARSAAQSARDLLS